MPLVPPLAKVRRETVRLEFLGEQADVPAEQPPAGEDPRVPPSDAHSRGPRDLGRAPLQGPLAAVGLTTSAAVLPAAARLRRRTEFTRTVRAGRRGSTPALVVHLDTTGESSGARAGFVVSRGVGGAVVRNRVRRVLRHLVRDRWDRLPAGAQLVVRANPGAADLSTAALADSLDRALARALGDDRPGAAR
jgi:ribonuclease P protein component